MIIERYTAAHLPALVRFWNAEFASFPRFAPVTQESLAARLGDPGELHVAVDAEVVGVVHAGVTGEEECRRRVPGWPGGTQGYVCLLAVARPRRRGGVGTALWHRAREALAGVKQVVIDGDGRNPWHSRPPAFGAPWGPAVAWADKATQKFLAMRGYGPRARAVDFGDAIVVPEAEPERLRALEARGARVADWALY